MRTTVATRGVAGGVIGLGVLLAGWAAGVIAPAAVGGPVALNTAQRAGKPVERIVAPDALKVKLFASGGSSLSNPDAIDVDGQHLWVAYQNHSVKDGTNNSITSTLVEYALGGDRDIVRTWAVPGHTDGVRVNPATHDVWVSSNEDGGPLLEIINQSSGAVTQLTIDPATPSHGGGYDDIEFLGGNAYIACSNPQNPQPVPAINKVTINGTTATMTPILMGNDSAYNTVTQSTTQLNLTDPDSLTVDSHGNLVLVSQGDSQIITITNPGAGQTVSVTPIGNQEDDTVWTTAKTGRLYLVDGSLNAIYSVAWTGAPGTVWTAAPNDSGVVSFVGTIDMTTGAITPVITGLGKPTGLIFVPGPG